MAFAKKEICPFIFFELYSLSDSIFSWSIPSNTAERASESTQPVIGGSEKLGTN